jgi:hypothetical protein
VGESKYNKKYFNIIITRFDNYALSSSIQATSESEDGQHPVRMAVDGSNMTFWQSRFNEENQQITL